MLLSVFHDEVWLPSCANLRECTMVGYESAYRRHIGPRFGFVDMADITVADVESWLAGIQSPGAARKAWAVLRAMLRKALRFGVLDVDITLRVQSPKQPYYRAPVLDARQIRTLLQGFYGHQLEAWLICAVTLGLRTEEGYGLEWSDIDLRAGVVHVSRGVQWVAGHEIVVDTKTEQSTRDVVLPRFAIQRLRELKGKGRLIGDLTPPQVARRYASWCRRNNLPYVPARNLRHSWGTTALAAGVDVAVVSRALGHSSISTTARYYLRPETSVLKDAQRKWEATILR